MLRYILLLASVGLTIGAPQNAGLSALIEKTFPKPVNKNPPVKSDPELDKLINNVFQIPNNGQQEQQQGGGFIGNNNGPGFGGNNGLQTSDNDYCECVPYYQCQNQTIVDDGVGIIDIRLKPGSCEISSLDVCCKPPEIIRDEKNIVRPPPFQSRGCGNRNPEGIGFRITGATNNEAQFGEFPWMVAVLKKQIIGSSQEKMNVYQCGGSLIHPQVVLTGAHCVATVQEGDLEIRAGEWDTQTKNEILPHQDRAVQRIIVHENYIAGSLKNDFALLYLREPLALSDNVDVVCLPQANDIFDNSRCFASGWGKDVFGREGHFQVILKRVELPVVGRDNCQSKLRNTRLGKHFVLDRSFICAGGEPGKDTCKGDGGSPLVCPLRNNPSRYVQAGAVAWGIGCGENGVPGVYANIANARPWIDEKMEQLRQYPGLASPITYNY
ncbi:hypothetical protein HCN44_008762 [Aphidius gifuensis]|uniref:Phenoloxidase-activating factor 2 n=2 Tax=Aphidius gifuensis TaxID=684658 RepID=A0A834XT58_APHGI|nr:hypothetical protein HCN44_008762 [Aphidius gifuensis]